MMPNDNIEAVRQHQMVVAWIRLRHMKKLKETKTNGQVNLPHKDSKVFLFKNPSNNKSNKNDINNNSDSNNNNNNDKMQRHI